MTKIIKIGNSRGIRIPSTILKESRIENDVEIHLSGDSLIIRPIPKNYLPSSDLTVLSEKALAKDWNRSEEDLAWKNL